MTEQEAHSVPLFEGSASRRHQRVSVAQLRGQAVEHAVSDAAPDVGGVQTLVQFAGFPRSGHSLVGSLIDAHPDAVVAHELDLMGLVENGLGRADLFSLICANSAEFERHGRFWNGFRYRVPAGSGGTSRRPVLLGDKKADWAVRRILHDPGLLANLGAVLGGVRAAWVVVVRNPFDNIATMSLRKGRAYDRIRIAAQSPEDFRRRLELAQGDRVPAQVLPEMVEDYATLCRGVAQMKAGVPAADWLELRHEDLVADPVSSLERLYAFLGLPVGADFVRSMATSVSTQANHSRHQIGWSGQTLDQVEQLVAQHSFLAGYGFDDR